MKLPYFFRQLESRLKRSEKGVVTEGDITYWKKLSNSFLMSNVLSTKTQKNNKL